MKRLVVATFMLATVVAIAQPQESLVGAYTGSFWAYVPAKGGEARINFELVITTVESDLVKGTANVLTGLCPGQYPMEGKFADNKLVMKSTRSGRIADCSFGFDVVREGNKFTGKTGTGFRVQFSR